MSELTPAPRRLSAISPLFDIYTAGRQLVLPWVLAVAGGAGEAFVGVMAITAAVMALRVATWMRRTYTIREGALVLDEGIIRRKQRIVPIERIQQVNVDRKLRHRIFGVAHLKIQTGSSGGGAELDLDAVTDAEAERLRHALRNSGQPAAGSVEPSATRISIESEQSAERVAPGRILTRMSYGDAVMSGITDARLPLFAALIAGAFQVLEVLGSRVREPLERVTGSLDLSGPMVVVAVTAALVAVMAIWLVVGALSGVLANAEYLLLEDGDRLTCTRGLLSKREVVLLRHRIQVVRVEASPIRRLIGRCSLVIQSAGKTGGTDRIDVPYLAMSEVEELVDALLPGTRPLPALHPHPSAAARRLRVRRMLLAVPVAAAAGGAGATVDARWWAAVPLSIVAAWVSAELSYLGLASGYRTNVLLTQRGALSRKLVVVPASRAQSARLHSSPLQRRSGLATLSVDVAGGGQTPQVADADGHELASLLLRLLVDRRVTGAGSVA